MKKQFMLIALVAAVLCGCNDKNAPSATVSLFPGELSGEFSVSATTKVHFSKGNLQATYDGSTWTWSFATNQWDYIGNAAANNAINGNGTASSNGTVDLFGWSTASTYYGINNSTSNSSYLGDFVDWGNNPITNGGNKANMWRTLTKDEWVYLFETRTDAVNKYGAAKVNDIPGVVLLPDNWTLPSGCGFTAGMITTSSWNNVPSTNMYDDDANQWSKMEKAGAVFLPAAGKRYNTNVTDVNSEGCYWSSIIFAPIGAYYLYFRADKLDSWYYYNQRRFDGQSVRLVR